MKIERQMTVEKASSARDVNEAVHTIEIVSDGDPHVYATLIVRGKCAIPQIGDTVKFEAKWGADG